MSRHWYAETIAWASIAKEKRQKRQRRRAGHGAYKPRGRSSDLTKDVKAAVGKIEAEELAQWAQVLGAPPREPV